MVKIRVVIYGLIDNETKEYEIEEDFLYCLSKEEQERWFMRLIGDVPLGFDVDIKGEVRSGKTDYFELFEKLYKEEDV